MNNLNDLLPSNSTPPSADYPYGAARNVTTSGDNTGTPFIAALYNDIIGLQQKLLSEAETIPDGSPDDAVNSQQFNAMWKLFNMRTLTHNFTSDVDYTLTGEDNLKRRYVFTDTNPFLTTSRNIKIDTTEKRFILENQTLQDLSVIVDGASGSSITVSPSSLKDLYSDGVDVSEINTTPDTGLPTITGTATFTNSTNNINLTGLGSLTGLEVGDVFKISGTTAGQNDGEFAVEVITDTDNVIVNQAHAGKSRTSPDFAKKSLIDESATAGVTISILVKWYNASIGLGQSWVDVSADRISNVTYINSTNRSIGVMTICEQNSIVYLTIDSLPEVLANNQVASTVTFSSFTTPSNSNYKFRIFAGAGIVKWYELR